MLQCVGSDLLGKLLQINLGKLTLATIFGLFLQCVFWPQAITNIGSGLGEVDMLVDKRRVIGLVLNNVIGDVIENRQVGLWRKHHAVIGQIKAAMPEGGEHMHLTARFGQTRIGKS